MSDDGYKLQTTIKHGPNMTAMTNIRANDVDELEATISGVIAAAPRIAEAIAAFGVVEVVATAMPGTQVIGTTNANSASNTIDRSPQFCPHGQMKFKETTDYAGHFCPADRSDNTRCKARYLPKPA